MGIKVVITDCTWADNSVEREVLQEIDAQLSRADCKTPEEVIAAARDADALLVGWAPISKEVIAALRRCRLMVRYGAGYNNVDVEAATVAGIAVAINADYCVDEVATHALALLLACHRQLGTLTSSVRSGTWDPLAAMRPMMPLNKQTVGILGFGRIGRRFAELVTPLVARVLACDPIVEAKGTAVPGLEFVSFDRLLADSDFISIHAPLNTDTRNLFSAKTLALLKPTAYVINVGRGGIVDENALVEALKANKLGGAALDVFSTEPVPIDHPLRSFPNVIITPHAAWYSSQADYLLRANPARAIVKFFKGEPVILLNEPRPRPHR